MATNGVHPETFATSYNEYFDVVRADTPALLDQALRLRYQVYCVENPFENSSEHIGGRETDLDDDRSVHTLLIHRRTGAVAGTVRLILPGKNAHLRPLPIQRIINPAYAAALAELSPGETGEISRFAVSKEFRRRCGEERYADIGFTGGATVAAGERRLIPYITFGLIRGVLEMCWEFKIANICAVMEPALIRLLARTRLFFEPIGDLVQHHGLRQPCAARVADLVDRTRDERAMLWRYAGEMALQSQSRSFATTVQEQTVRS